MLDSAQPVVRAVCRQCKKFSFLLLFHIFLGTCRLPCDQLQKAEASEVDEVDEEPAVVQSAQLFAPKSLVLVSRLDYTDVFRVRTR